MSAALVLRAPERLLEELDDASSGFSYVCRRCDVWGRVPAGLGRRCWACERTDRLELR